MDKPLGRLKAYRAENGLTQEEMAKALGMAVTTYNLKENGIREFRLSEVAKAQQELGLDPQYYFFYIYGNRTVTK